ncbi:MAG: stage III sporulation protein AB [Clostridia bacterium]|nr:stage III sporulation protein AB [Clostridia bacterium]
MRVIGILLLSSCPLILGFCASANLKKKLQQTELIVVMISSIKQYICYEALTRDGIFCRLAEDEQYKALGFWQCDDISELVTKNQALVIDKPLKQKLMLFLNGIGSTDISGQMSHCELYSSMFSDSLSKLREEASQKQKLYCSLGSFAAMFVAVVLI